MFSAEIMIDRVVMPSARMITRYSGSLINDLLNSFNFNVICSSAPEYDPKLHMGSLFLRTLLFLKY